MDRVKVDRRTRTVWIGLCSKCNERALRPELDNEKIRHVVMSCKCGTLVECQRVTFTGQALTPQPREFHHVWCNGHSGPVLGCRWCLHQDKDGNWTGLWINYPYDPMTTQPHHLMKKYFPQNLSRT